MINRPDGAYASSDLFKKHPSIPNAYKFVGRLDDTITLYNGEKTNPIKYELTLRESPHIKDAIVFGNGQMECGVLVLAAGPVDDIKQFKTDIDPVLRKANESAESHAQITSDMVCVLDHETILPRTDKGTVLRPAMYRRFKEQIELMYEKGQTASGKKAYELDELKTVLRNMVLSVRSDLSESLQSDSDLFALGLDSLQSVKVRNSIVSEIDVVTTHYLSISYTNTRLSKSVLLAYILPNSMGSADLDKQVGKAPYRSASRYSE